MRPPPVAYYECGSGQHTLTDRTRTTPAVGTDTLYRTVGQDNRRRLLLDDEGEAEPEAAAAPGPEYDLAADRSSIAMDPATLSDVTLRYGTYLPEIQAGLGRRRLLEAEAEAEAEAEPEIGEAVAHLLSDATELAGDVMTGVAEAFAAAPSPEADLASERGRLGGRVGYNFGTGTLYTQNRYNDRLRRHLLEEAEAEAEAEAEPEIGEAVTHLLSDATELAGDVMTGIAEAFAPMEEAMERGRLTNRVGFNANTGQSWQFTGYARKTSQSSRRVHLPLTACLLRTDGQQQQQQQHTKTTTEAAAIRSQGAVCLKRRRPRRSWRRRSLLRSRARRRGGRRRRRRQSRRHWRRRRRPDLRTSMIFRQHARRSRLTQPRSAGLSFATERTLAKSSRTASKQEEEEQMATA